MYQRTVNRRWVLRDFRADQAAHRRRPSMGSVHIKDEARGGSQAKYKLEPSVYLQKLYESGTPDLGWMNQMGEWGGRTTPGTPGFRHKDLESGRCAIPPEPGAAHRWMAPRGAVISD